ncbi:MAG: hypothetical protein R6W82_06565 [bacterium]
MTSPLRNTLSVLPASASMMAALVLLPGTVRAQGDFEGHWEGAIELPGAELEILSRWIMERFGGCDRPGQIAGERGSVAVPFCALAQRGGALPW